MLETRKVKAPNVFLFVRSAARALRALATGHDIVASDATIDKRRHSCRTCPHLDGVIRQCKVCTCMIDLKTQFRTEACPVGRWGKERLTTTRLFRTLTRLWPKVTE